MSKLTKNQKLALSKLEAGRTYTLAEAVELVKASGFAQQVGARTQVQVVGIAQDYLGLDIVAHLRHQHPFDSAAGAYGHENRGFDFSVAGGYQSGACVGAGGGGL